jgi:hypothetical protein
MGNGLRADVAHMVAKLVARRATAMEELPELMRVVETALVALASPPVRDETRRPELARHDSPVSRRARRQTRDVADAPQLQDEAPQAAAAPPPPPRLVRRAEAGPAPAPESSIAPRPAGVLRGIVKWFDQRTRRGALQLPGFSDDVALEPMLLDEMGLSRLYKGQEVVATLGGDPEPRLVRLALPGGVWQVHATGGIVHNRHAKPVVVELKREALRRAAARAEAETLLGPNRAR